MEALLPRREREGESAMTKVASTCPPVQHHDVQVACGRQAVLSASNAKTIGTYVYRPTSDTYLILDKAEVPKYPSTLATM